MSQFNKLGLGGVKPGTYDFDPDAQINQDVDTTGYSRFSNTSLGKPNINNLESLINATNLNDYVGIMGLEADLDLPSNDLMADVSANDLRAIGKYNKNQDINDIRMFEPNLNPTLTDQEIKGILDNTITAPTGKFA